MTHVLQITDIHSTCQVLLRKKLLWCLRHAKAAGGVAVTMAAIARRHRNPMGFFSIRFPQVLRYFLGYSTRYFGDVLTVFLGVFSRFSFGDHGTSHFCLVSSQCFQQPGLF